MDIRLIIEPRMHLEAILDASIDAVGRYLSTSGADGVRLWDVEQGVHLAYLPEVGPAAALAPDGKRLVVARDDAAVLLARDTGRVLGWVYAGFSIDRLAFSANGEYLLLGGGSSGQAGVQVRRSQDGTLLWNAALAVSARQAADLDSTGRALTYAYGDQELQLRNGRGAVAVRVPAPDVACARLSRDGRRVAVARAGGVELRSGRDLSLLRQVLPPGRGARRVAFCPDGRHLYAAGLGPDGAAFLHRAPLDEDAPAETALPTSGEITALLGLPRGVSLFTSTEPAWGVVDRALDLGRALHRTLARLSPEPGDLRAGQSGAQLRFAFLPGRDVAQLALSEDEAQGGLSDALEDVPLLLDAPWLKILKPGEQLRIIQEDEERERREVYDYDRYAISTDGERCLIQSGSRLLCVRTAVVKQDWSENMTPCTGARALALAGSYRQALVLDDDSVLRVYGASGKRQVSVVLAADRQRWLAFTDTGHFCGSPDSDHLAGFQIRKDGPLDQALDQAEKERKAQRGEVDVPFGIGERRRVEALFGRDHEKRMQFEAEEAMRRVRNRQVEEQEHRRGWREVPDAALIPDFFPLADFRHALRRPDLVALTAAGKGEASSRSPAAASASTPTAKKPAPAPDIAQLLPPALRVIEPVAGEILTGRTCLVHVGLRLYPGRPLTALRAYVDGTLCCEVRDRGLHESFTLHREGGLDEEVHQLEVPLPAADFTLSVGAESDGVSSGLLAVPLRYGGGAHLSAARHERDAHLRPSLYVLSIGVSAYKEEHLRLGFADQDAKALAALLQRQEGQLYGRMRCRLLVNEEVTQDSVLEGLQWLREQATSRDVSVVFLAGHGMNDPATGRYYYLPHDADVDAVMRTMVPSSEIRETLSRLCGKAVCFMDTCHAGSVFGEKARFRNILTEKNVAPFVNELASADNGLVVFAAASGRQFSQEREEWGHGAFTRALLDGLSGAADARRTGRVTVANLEAYLCERVKEMTGGAQTPTVAKPQSVPDFPLVQTLTPTERAAPALDPS